MFRRGSSAYRQMGYSVVMDTAAAPNRFDFR